MDSSLNNICRIFSYGFFYYCYVGSHPQFFETGFIEGKNIRSGNKKAAYFYAARFADYYAY